MGWLRESPTIMFLWQPFKKDGQFVMLTSEEETRRGISGILRGKETKG